MEKTDKPLTRDALISMQVIDAKGHIVGTVKDVIFEVGKTGISLLVEKEEGETQTVGWGDIQAACDFIILKPAPGAQTVTAAQPEQETKKVEMTSAKVNSSKPLCPTCNQPLTWIPQYKRWYCYNEKKYV